MWNIFEFEQVIFLTFACLKQAVRYLNSWGLTTNPVSGLSSWG